MDHVIAKDADQRARVEAILMVPNSAAAIRPCLTTDHSLDLGVDFTEEPEKNPRSTGKTNYNNSTHMSSKFENLYITLSDQA